MLIQLFLILNYYHWWASFELIKFILNKKCSNVTNVRCSWAESNLHRISLCSSPHQAFTIASMVHEAIWEPQKGHIHLMFHAIGSDCSEVRIDKDSEFLWIKERIMQLNVAICQRFSIRTCGWGVTFCHLMCNKNNFGLGKPNRWISIPIVTLTMNKSMNFSNSCFSPSPNKKTARVDNS